jgi:hypothetical protein
VARFLVGAALNACSRPLRLSPPRILDPACGGGAFLIAAFRELRRRYPDEDPQAIATQCLRGVDSDPDAVHVARLSLLLEAELPDSAWPLLESAVKVGDSLREGLVDGHRRFPVVVGNPPYRNVKRGIPDELAEFCKANYRSARGQWDLAAPFVELALLHLLEAGGACGFIVPSPLLLAENYRPIREIILQNDLVAFGPAGAPFADPGVEASLLVVRAAPPKRQLVTVLEGRGKDGIRERRKVPATLLRRLPFRVFSHAADPDMLRIVFRGLDRGRLVHLGERLTFKRGIECGKRDNRISEASQAGSGGRPLIVGQSVAPFFARPAHRFKLMKREKAGSVLKDARLWRGKSRLLLRRVADRPIAAVALPPALVLNTLYVVTGDGTDSHSVCALLNSKPFAELFRQLYGFEDRLFPYLRVSQLSQVPVPPEMLSDAELSRCSRDLHGLASRDPAALEGAEAVALLDCIDSLVWEAYVRE